MYPEEVSAHLKLHLLEKTIQEIPEITTDQRESCAWHWLMTKGTTVSHLGKAPRASTTRDLRIRRRFVESLDCKTELLSDCNPALKMVICLCCAACLPVLMPACLCCVCLPVLCLPACLCCACLLTCVAACLPVLLPSCVTCLRCLPANIACLHCLPALPVSIACVACPPALSAWLRCLPAVPACFVYLLCLSALPALPACSERCLPALTSCLYCLLSSLHCLSALNDCFVACIDCLHWLP